MDDIEIWKPVVGFEGLYEVSDHGRVRSLDREIECMSRWGTPVRKMMKGRLLRTPTCGSLRKHRVVSLGRGNWTFVHRLVLFAFVGPCPDGFECRHLDGDGGNNKLANLTWGSRNENIADRKQLGEENPARGEMSGRSILTESDVRFIRHEKAKGRSNAEIGRDLGISRNTVRKVVIGYTWGWLE